MHVEFQVQKLLGSIDINDNLRELYERTIEAVVLSHQDILNIDKLAYTAEQNHLDRRN